MSKAVMISIKPKWVELIASGEKTVEIRKSHPKIDVPFKCYIYCTKSNGWYGTQSKDNPAKRTNAVGKVVGEFVCDWIGDGAFMAGGAGSSSFPIYDGPCLDLDDYMAYVGVGKEFFGWHISNLNMYDKPKELSDFMRACNHESDCFTCKYWKNNTYDCLNRVQRAPQSYCFVEEL